MKIFVKDVQTSLCLWSKLSPFTHFVSMIDFEVGECKCGVKNRCFLIICFKYFCNAGFVVANRVLISVSVQY